MISVIIPVYNAAKWLPQCLESVLGQHHRNIEVILVNDASTDKSLVICKQYAAKDDRIIVIDKPANEGVELARQSGYAIAHGTYVIYVDADDWFDHPLVLSRMYEIAEETQADYVSVGWQRVFDRHKWLKSKYEYPVQGLIEQPALGEMYRYFIVNSQMLEILWGKLYRKSVIDRAAIRPFGMIYGEDALYNMQLFPHLNRVYFMSEVGYNYRYGGMTSRYNPRVFADLKRMYGYKKSIVERFGYPYLDMMNIWLKNVLKSEICQRIEFSCDQRSDTIAYIREEMHRPLYDDLQTVSETSEFWNDPFVHAFFANDADGLYDICRKLVHKEHPKRVLKRFLVNTLLRNL